jgi:hypothetical protein
MNLNNLKFDKKQEYSDGKYSIFSFSGEKGKFKRLSCDSTSICVIPFNTNDNNQVKNVFLAKYQDYLSNSLELRCISDTVDLDKFDSYYSALLDCVKHELNLENIDVNDIYYLGKIKHTVPFSKEYRCYGVNISSFSDTSSNFTPTLNSSELDNRLHTLETVKFSRVLSGEICDSLTLSASLLLLSYLND